MACQVESTIKLDAVKLLAEEGFAGLDNVISLLCCS